MVAAAWIALALVALDGVATAKLVRSDAFTRRQKVLQAALVSLVPIFGALGVLYFTRYLASEPRDVPWERDVPGPSSDASPSIAGITDSPSIPPIPTIHGDS